jgi:hypothetical protein
VLNRVTPVPALPPVGGRTGGILFDRVFPHNSLSFIFESPLMQDCFS